MSASTMIELRPNRDLLDVNFGGYKLSLESVPSYQVDLSCDVDHVLPSDEQYSFLHLKVFSLHNHLYYDPWNQEHVYYIDKKWRVNKNVTNSQTGRLEGVHEVWEIPGSHPRKPGHYNSSLCFASPTVAVIADGTGMLYIIQTGSRVDGEAWKALFNEEIFGEQSFLVADSRIHDIEGKIELHCLLMWVEESVHLEGEPRHRSGNFQSTLTWLVFAKGESGTSNTGNWTLSRSYQLSGRGGLDYAAFASDCSALYTAGEQIMKFTHESGHPIEQLEFPLKKESNNVSEMGAKKHYIWQQTADDIEIKFKVGKEIEKHEIQVDVKERSINITCRGKTLLSGDVWGCTDPSLTCWTVDKGRLNITIVKAETGLMWKNLVPSDTLGEEVLDPALVEEVHQRLAHLCSDQEVSDTTNSPAFNSAQLEECDTSGMSDKLVRLDPSTYTMTHQASLGGHQALFCTRLSPDEAPALCLRHDVDGCIWQPSSTENLSAKWPIEHIGTFHAFGYVQASKQQRKFSVCALDLSYVAICDAVRHIYIYHQPVSIEGRLKNRRTGQTISQTAQQQLVALPDTSEVLGAYAGKCTLYVLTSKYLLALNINQ